MKTIGLDIGTTSICGILLNTESKKSEKTIALENNSFVQSSNLWEKIQDANVILKKVEEILLSLISEDVVAIGVTGQMHGILYVNKDGEAKSPLYTWQDGRGNQPYEDTTYAKYMNSFAGYGTVTDYYNEVNGLLPKESVKFCTIQDYIVMKLAQLREPVTHISDAASFGNYNLNNHMITLCNERLPDITKEFLVLGKYKNIPITAAIGDNQASFIGSCIGRDGVLVNVGTGSQVSFEVNQIYNVSNMETRPLTEDRYLLAGSALCGGRSFAALENFYKEVVVMAGGTRPESLYEKMCGSLNGTYHTDIIFHNKFAGTRMNPEERGSILNLSLSNFSVSDFTMGMLEGIARELHEMYGEVTKECVNLIGAGNGIRKNKILQNIFSNMFGCALKVPVHSEEACYGAAIAALVGCGEFSDLEEAQKIIQYEV